MQCENGHELAKNFPYDSFWAYCCDCNVFSSWLTTTGIKAESNCSVCNRLIARRYLCHRCRMVSFKSDENKPTKFINLGANGSPTPYCPGCLEAPGTVNVVEHECINLSISYHTAREVCPFCNEWITRAGEVAAATLEEAINATEVDQPVINLPFLESFAQKSVSFWRPYLPDSRNGWLAFVTVASGVMGAIALLLAIFPSVPAAVWWRISKAVKSPLKVSQIDYAGRFVLKGDNLRLKVRVEEPANGLKFEWISSAGNLINHKEQNRESEVELATDSISAGPVPVEVTIGVTVVDEFGDSVLREERIAVVPRRLTNNPPVLKIPPRCNCPVQEVIAGENVSLYALAEDEDASGELTYDWQSSSPSVQIINTRSNPGSTVILSTAGVNPRLNAVPIKVTLRVNDGSGGAVTGDITLMILPRQSARTTDTAFTTPPPVTNHSPKLEAFVADKTIVEAGETITLWAYVTDPDGDEPIFYDWRASSGDIQNKRETAMLSTSGITSSKIIVVLTVSDGHGGRTSQQMPIDVRTLSLPPAAPSPTPHATEIKDH